MQTWVLVGGKTSKQGQLPCLALGHTMTWLTKNFHQHIVWSVWLPFCEFLAVMSEVSCQTDRIPKPKWNAMFCYYICLPNITGGYSLWSHLALFKSLSFLEHLSVHALAQFGWQGVNRGCFVRMRAHWGATTGSCLLSGLLVLHKDYFKQGPEEKTTDWGLTISLHHTEKISLEDRPALYWPTVILMLYLENYIQLKKK